ncbi:MAG: ribonuclease [Nocardioidaceae bacterium]|nr:ribonuclease [Nocardioidaceae bacterium]
MTDRVLHVSDAATDRLRQGIAQIQAEQKVTPVFPPEVEAAAKAVRPTLPDKDLTALEFVTIDPAASMDLDQAMFLERDGDGYVVHYAIADLATFVEPGGPIDVETHHRGETLYGGDATIPLHPTVLSEGGASLLPDQERPSLVWTIHLDKAGTITDRTVERARVRSRLKLSYDGCQADIDAGTASPLLGLLEEIGKLRQQQETDRGGVSLPMPEQQVDIEGDAWRLEFRSPHPVEGWNAQISLLTGIAAADIMLKGGIGVLRTLPPAPDWAVDKLRRRAKALGVDWPADLDYPAFVRSLDPTKPNHAAMTVACTTLLRGAGYASFDGTPPEQPEHAALATTYAHVTAPLRRLVDRYGLEVCVALCAGEEVPQWVRTALPDLPQLMRDGDSRAHAYENAVLDLVEAEILAGSVGETFPAVVLESDKDHPSEGKIQIADPAVEAKVTSQQPVPVGEAVTVTLTTADPATRKVAFTL